MGARVKNMKRQLDDSEEEVTRLNGTKRKLQRDLDENNEALESSQREVNQLRQRLRGGVGVRTTTTTRTRTSRKTEELEVEEGAEEE